MWKFWWYNDPIGRDPWRNWYDSLDGAGQGRHDIVFDFLESRPKWSEPYSKKLTDEDDLVEIILKTKIQHRLMGFYWPERLNFTILLPCNHKGTVYDPPNAIETAKSRIKELKNGKRWIKYCVRPK